MGVPEEAGWAARAPSQVVDRGLTAYTRVYGRLPDCIVGEEMSRMTPL